MAPLTTVPRPARLRPWQCWTAAVLIVAAVAYGVVGAFFGSDVRDPIVAWACRLTGCAGAGLAAAGWLVITAPLLWAALGAALWRRLGRDARLAWVGFGAILTALAYLFVPGGGTGLDGLLTGSGGPAFATGVRWAGLGVVTVIVVWVIGLIIADQRPAAAALTRPVTVVVAGLGSLVFLAVGIGRADMPPLTAAEMFGDKTFTVAGDTVTVASTADTDGCAGVVVDPGQLDGCVRTAEAVFTTDDSAARVHLAAVLFASRAEAEARRDGLPAVAGDVLATRTVHGGWLVLTTVRHADGRPVTEADKGELLWALEQVGYHFTSRAGTPRGPGPS